MKCKLKLTRVTSFFLSLCASILPSYSQAQGKIPCRLTLSISSPLVHNNIITLTDSVVKNNSFLGLSAGLGYYFNDNNYINLIAGFTTSSEVPFPIGVDHFGNYERYNSVFAGLTSNHIISSFLKNKLHYSLGMNYTVYQVSFYYYNLDSVYWTSKVFTKNTTGLSIGLKYRFSKHWLVGIQLNSSLYNFTSSSFEYNHLAYIDIIFRFGTKRL